MAANLIPYGELAGGNYGILLDTLTSKPLATAIEVVQALPDVVSLDNFDGRVVFVVPTAIAYAFSSTPTPLWVALEGVPAQVGHVNGNPPAVPEPITGTLFFDLDTGILFLWDGTGWRGVGGFYPAQIIQVVYTGDGVTQNFPSGTQTGLASQFVEVFLNGDRQRANPTGDYSITGTNVVFNNIPTFGVKILIRSLVRTAITTSSQLTLARYSALPGQTTFSINAAQVDSNRILVFLNGNIQQPSLNYVVSQQNTTITNIVKLTPTSARATMAGAHNMIVGQGFTIAGAAQTYYNRAFSVLAILSANTISFIVDNAAPATTLGNPTISFSPASLNDNVVFLSPMVGGEKIDIRTFKNLPVDGAPSASPSTTITSVGSGEAFDLPPLGSLYEFRSLSVRSPFTITQRPTDLTIGLGPNNFAQLNQPTNWSARVSGSPTVPLLDAATILWDMRFGNTFLVVLNGNRILATPTGVTDGDSGVLLIKQGIGGNFTITWPSIFKWPAGITPVLDTLAGKVNLISYNVSGSNIYAVWR